MFTNFGFQSLLKTATDCCQADWQIQRNERRTQHVSLDNACSRTVNCSRTIEKQHWPLNSPDLNLLEIWEAMHEALCKLRPKPKKTVSELKVALNKILFRRSKLTKLQRVLERVEKVHDGRLVEDILSIYSNSKNVHTSGVCVLIC